MVAVIADFADSNSAVRPVAVAVGIVVVVAAAAAAAVVVVVVAAVEAAAAAVAVVSVAVAVVAAVGQLVAVLFLWSHRLIQSYGSSTKERRRKAAKVSNHYCHKNLMHHITTCTTQFVRFHKQDKLAQIVG